MIFIIITLFCGALVKYKLQSYSPLLMVSLGAVIYYINQINNHVLNNSIEQWGSINSTIIFRYLIPPLIYNSAAHIEFHILRQYLKQILILIIPVLVINILTMGYLLSLLENTFSLQLCLLFGTIISATDPVSVLAILEHTNMSKKVKTLIDGEALLNDAVVYLFFSIILDYEYTAITKVFYIPLGSVILGSVSFIILFQILRKIYESDIEIILTIIFCHGTFYVAEIMKLSGVLSTVIVGLWMSYIGKTAISPSVKKSLEYVWKTFDVNMNHLIFALSGLIGIRTINFVHGRWYNVIILYIGTNLFRIFSILLFSKFLKHRIYKIETKQLILVGLSNIKGAITITLALQLTETSLHNTELILFYTFATTFLTLTINPLLIKLYIKYILKHEYNEAVEYLLRIRDKLNTVGYVSKEKLQRETEYLHNINWVQIDKYMIKNNTESHIEMNIEPINDKNIEYRIVYLTTLKKSFWQLFDDHLLYKDTITKLIEIIDNVLDTENKHWLSCFLKYCQFPVHYKWVPEWYKRKILYHSINHRHNLILGYILGHQITIEHLESVFEENCEIINELRNEQLESIKFAKLFLTTIEETYPDITKKIETRQAIYHVLKKQQHYLKNIFKEGKINYYIYNHINQEINNTLYDKMNLC